MSIKHYQSVSQNCIICTVVGEKLTFSHSGHICAECIGELMVDTHTNHTNPMFTIEAFHGCIYENGKKILFKCGVCQRENKFLFKFPICDRHLGYGRNPDSSSEDTSDSSE